VRDVISLLAPNNKKKNIGDTKEKKISGCDYHYYNYLIIFFIDIALPQDPPGSLGGDYWLHQLCDSDQIQSKVMRLLLRVFLIGQGNCIHLIKHEIKSLLVQ